MTVQNHGILDSVADLSPTAGKFPRHTRFQPSRCCNTPVLPEHWEERPLARLVKINEHKLGDSTNPDFEIEYVDIGNVDMIAGITSTERLRFEDAPSRARRRLADGDTIISTVRTYLKAVARIVSPPTNLIGSTGFAVLTPRADYHPGYLFRLVQSEAFVQKVMAHSVGVSYPAINAPDIGKFLVPLPPIAEQREIAAFLDRETDRIDGLIAGMPSGIDGVGSVSRLVRLLQEYRSALITAAVTGQIDVRAVEVSHELAS